MVVSDTVVSMRSLLDLDESEFCPLGMRELRTVWQRYSAGALGW